MLNIPNNSQELFDELEEFARSLPKPLNELFLIDIYKLYAQHKIDYISSTIIENFDPNGLAPVEPQTKLKTKG